jgi:MoaA/NifB/PqqE/SkfB family radical SAM enzyme
MIPREARCGDDDLVGMEPAAQIVRTAQVWAHDNLVPLNASLEITLACNIRCVHCYNFDRDQPLRRTGAAPDGAPGSVPVSACATERPELSTDEILRLMDDLRAAGCLFLSLTGGEVLSHPDLFVFLDRARDLNLAVQLLTNGTLLRPGIAKRLGSYANLLGVSVSLYGASAAVHDGITQVKGSFARTWAGVERLRAAGVVVRLKFIVMRQNAHETA